ncbi:MAG: hypothetical protein H7Y11_09990 [Armatimonadetes bacterium]|nr:hypothetical protein [Anaerolineae bacterium]
MAYKILVHVANSEPVKLDVDVLPSPTDTSVVGRNPRDRGDKEVTWVEEGVTTVIFPWWRINYIQVLASEEDKEEFAMPFRND